MTPYKLQKSILSLKSWLFTPATKSDKFSRAAEVHADALIIDLEDSVAPSAKREALVVNRKGVGTVDHRIVDEALARNAKLVLERAGLID